nr:retrovirus-related Pol polyprotein from transposon TNT 1-94 [Tanacetum cinerariifolium]
MEAVSKDRPPMLVSGNYIHWKSRIKRYIHTKPNHELIHYCLNNPPYKYTWSDKVVPVSEGSPETTTERANQDNSLRINKGTGYDNQRVVTIAEARENVGTKVTPDAVETSGPIFDVEPLEKVQHNDDIYDVFAISNEHLDQPNSIHNTYLKEQTDSSIIIDSLDMCNNGETDDQDDDELTKERDLFASLIEKLKCKIDENKELEKVIALENKVQVLDNIVYKTGQTVQTMNMLNRNCKTSFVKPEFLKKDQRANPRLYDIGTVKFGNDQIVLIHGYGDLVQGEITIKKVYYIEGLNHNLFSVGFCDADLEVAFRKSTCFIRDLKGNDLLTVRTDNGTEFLNKTFHAYFAQEGLKHQTFIARTPEQNGIVERWNRTFVEATRTMLSTTKVPLYFWAETIATACFTQNRSLVIPQHKKTPYHIINGQKPSVKFFYIFGSLCYILGDGENLEKMKEKGDACIFVRLSPGPQSQENVPYIAKTVTMSNELDLLFSLMFDELLNGTTVVSKSFAVNAANAHDKRQQQTTTQSSTKTVAADIPSLNIQSTPEPTCQPPTQVPPVTAPENNIQAELNEEDAQVKDDEFINIFCTSEELHQFDRLDVWELVDIPLCKNVIIMKWIWKNKRDEENTVIRNKALLVAKGYAQ